MKLLHNLNASGMHAALCLGVPRFSCADAIVLQATTVATTAKRSLNLETMLHRLSRPPLDLDRQMPEISTLPSAVAARAADSRPCFPQCSARDVAQTS
jgi:hypothetical protein